MANTTFSPVIFNAETIKIFDQKNVFMDYADTKYEGSIKSTGDTVHVQTAPTFSFSASSITGAGASTFTTGTGPGGDISATDVTFTGEKLTINKYLEFRAKLSDFEKVQSNLPLESVVASRVGVGYANMMDNQFRDQVLVTDVATIPSGNKLYSGAPKADVSKTTIYGYIEEMRVQLVTSINGDPVDPVLFLCPKHFSALLQSGVNDSNEQGWAARKTGQFTMVGGVRVVQTPQLTASFEMIMMDANTVNFATQIVKSDVRQSPTGFYDNFLFTAVWGAKIFTERAKGIVIFYASA